VLTLGPSGDELQIKAPRAGRLLITGRIDALTAGYWFWDTFFWPQSHNQTGVESAKLRDMADHCA
jgi:hypothetical protein